jgi:NADH-quinone oxidoreductase subunit L
MLAILVIVPLVVAAFAALLMKKSKDIKFTALCASIGSLVLIIIAATNADKIQSITWFSIFEFQFVISTSTLPLNMLLLSILGIMTPLIISYSIGFMNIPSEQSRYYFELCIFAASMMLFSIAADFITMLIGWELLGITSYLLIGFWYQREGTAQAARKAITTILIGDIMMFFAIILIWNAYHTFSFAALMQNASGLQSGTMALALMLIIFAAFTKSAQVPFHEWLADAMKGPTPVSAFLHSSTMVKAGVFLIAVLLPLIAAYHLLYILLIFGMITSVVAVTNALTELHIKRVLAYSTMEDLGLMFIALGTGSLVAAMMLFFVQTFYKALLFMSAGAAIKANGNEENMEKMYNPIFQKLFIPTLVGAVSLAGLFPLGGFFGKSAIALNANSIVLYIILAAIGFLSNIYIFRWLFLPMRKKAGKKIIEVEAAYRTMPISMTIPIYVLMFLVIAGSLSYTYLPSYLAASIAIPISINEIILSFIVVAVALILSYWLFYRKEFMISEQNSAYKFLYSNMITNRFYFYAAKAVMLAASTLESIDHSFYALIKEGAHGTNRFGNVLKKVENGNVNTYIAIFIAGLVVIVLLFIS